MCFYRSRRAYVGRYSSKDFRPPHIERPSYSYKRLYSELLSCQPISTALNVISSGRLIPAPLELPADFNRSISSGRLIATALYRPLWRRPKRPPMTDLHKMIVTHRHKGPAARAPRDSYTLVVFIVTSYFLAQVAEGVTISGFVEKPCGKTVATGAFPSPSRHISCTPSFYQA